ncbi:MAG TPA: hypothetical protein VI776_15955 [Anaerolineales bacterium]|jgi:hypothetical protein|nr:hypothetical protein [Anaerolineales bacterium]
MVSHTAIEETEAQPRLVKGLVVGGVLGAAVGVAAAYMLIQSMERNNRELSISAGEGLRLGLIVMALLRQIADLPESR